MDRKRGEHKKANIVTNYKVSVLREKISTHFHLLEYLMKIVHTRVCTLGNIFSITSLACNT